jgi:hypothetical protein
MLNKYKPSALSIGALSSIFAAVATSFFVAFTPVSAARLDGCSPSAPENQDILGSVWKSKCLKASVNSVWTDVCNNLTLKEAKKASSKNECWKLMSQEEYAKQK